MSRARKGCSIAAVVGVLLIVAAGWGTWAALGHGAIIYRGIGWVCADSKSYGPAADWYGKAVRAQPKRAELRLEYAHALAGAGRLNEALKESQEAARLSPQWPEPLLESVRLGIKSGRLDQAQQALDEAMKLSPSYADSELALGRLRAAQGKYAEAAGALEHAVMTKPDLAGAYGDLGQVYEKQKKPDEALKTYREGAAAGDDTSRARLVALGQTPPAPTYAAGSSGSSVSTSSSSSSTPPPALFGFMGVFFVLYFVFIGFMVLLALFSWVVSLLAIYDCARRDFEDPNMRALWCLVIALLRWIGAIVYYFAVYRKGDPLVQQKRVWSPPPPPISAG